MFLTFYNFLELVQLFPTADRFLKWVDDFREHGNKAPMTPGCVPYVVTPENDARVRVSVEESPRRSTRHRGQALGISRRCLETIFNKHSNGH